MQSSTLHPEHSHISLGERRGRSDLARFSLDTSWAREVSDGARSRAYPSPPMSGSPPLPLRRIPDSSSDRGHGSYGSGGQDVFRGIQQPQPEHSDRRGPPSRSYPDQAPPPVYPGPHRLETMPTMGLPYQQLPQIASQQHRGYASHPPPPSATYSSSSGPPAIRDAPDFTSPKQQRKTKGHVASACVPCKRAHLRCDAQRPCSRCLSNGKEDTCVDVQHKKRGRPRLRDERESRYEGVGPGYPPPDPAMRRPISLYTPNDGSQFADVQRSNSYRVLKSQNQMGGPMGQLGGMPSRYLDHAATGAANLYGGPMHSTPRPMTSQEPACAYLTMEMEFQKASTGFGETIGLPAPSVINRKLHDVVSVNDREKVARLRRVFETERREGEPNYLPPIYVHRFDELRVIQSVSFGPEDTGRISADSQEVLTFQAQDGQQRTFHVRLGLTKKESTYFIALFIQIPATPRPFHQPSSAYSREPWSQESQYGFRPSQPGYQQGSGSAPYTPQQGFGDGRGDSATCRTPGPLGPSIPPQSSNMPSFVHPHARPDYAQGPAPYQTPRNEMPPDLRQRPPHDLQLPPIRDQRAESNAMDPKRQMSERARRLDIGGLLEKPDLGGRRP